MNNYDEILEKLIAETKNIDTINIEDIPNIDLYMDQVTTFMENNLHCFKRCADDKILTKTMINNYTKAKVFPPPVKKKYNKNHMMLLIIVYHLKSILSINDINRLLNPITDELKTNEKSETLEIVYKSFVALQKNNKDNILSEVTGNYSMIDTKSDLQNIKNKDKIDLILTVMLLVIQSNTEKRMAEKILDQFF